MKNKVGIILSIIILLTGIYTPILVTNASNETTIENIDYSPEKPAPESTVTFNTTVIGSNISVVKVWIQECKKELCYIPQNVTMQKIDVNKYQKNVTLKHKDATVVHYQIIVESDGNWYKSELEEFNLSVKEDHVTENNTPGFEFVYLAISFMLILFMYKRKRLG